MAKGLLLKLACSIKYAGTIVDDLADGFAENSGRKATASTIHWTEKDVTFANRLIIPSDEELRKKYEQAFQTNRNDNLAKIAADFFLTVQIRDSSGIATATRIYDKTLLESVLIGRQRTLPVQRDFYFMPVPSTWTGHLFEQWAVHQEAGLKDAQKNLDDLYRQGKAPC